MEDSRLKKNVRGMDPFKSIIEVDSNKFIVGINYPLV